jgi:hypothetical protein
VGEGRARQWRSERDHRSVPPRAGERSLWARYKTPYLESVVAFAIKTSVLSRDTVPSELLEHLAGAMRFYEGEQAPTDRAL